MRDCEVLSLDMECAGFYLRHSEIEKLVKHGFDIGRQYPRAKNLSVKIEEDYSNKQIHFGVCFDDNEPPKDK